MRVSEGLKQIRELSSEMGSGGTDPRIQGEKLYENQGYLFSLNVAGQIPRSLLLSVKGRVYQKNL